MKKLPNSEVGSFTAKEHLGPILELYDLATRFNLPALARNCRAVLRELLGMPETSVRSRWWGTSRAWNSRDPESD